MVRIQDIRFETEWGLIASATIPPRVRARDLIGRQLRLNGDVFLISKIHRPQPILNGKPIFLQLEQVSNDQVYELLMISSTIEE